MMNGKRLIDANQIAYHVSGFPKGDGQDSHLDWAFREDIEKLPTIEAVEVVHCKDCKHFELQIASSGAIYKFCQRYGKTVYVDDFCSYGERKGGQAPQREDV